MTHPDPIDEAAREQQLIAMALANHLWVYSFFQSTPDV